MTFEQGLLRLQSLDSEADEGKRRLRAVEAALGDSEAVAHARLHLEQARASSLRWAAQQQDHELKLGGLQTKIAASEDRLYGGTIKNARQLSELQTEVASLRRRQQRLEDELLAAMIGREEADEGQASAEQNLAQTEAAYTTRQAELLAEREGLQARLAEIGEERSRLLPSFDASLVATYEDLRRRKGGIAVAAVRDGACGACGISLSPRHRFRLRDGKLVTCGNCERIAVRA
jgi:predicted  nucleic acid-binding Zn-ribbon protein